MHLELVSPLQPGPSSQCSCRGRCVEVLAKNLHGEMLSGPATWHAGKVDVRICVLCVYTFVDRTSLCALGRPP